MRSWFVGLVLGVCACKAAGTGDDVGDTDTDTTAEPFANNPLVHESMLNSAHRGGSLLAPEETMEALQNAVDLGADVLEIDVWSTSDGVLVLNHDPVVDRTTNGTGNVIGMTWAELEALDAGYTFTTDDGATFPYRGVGVKIARLDEVFAAFPDSLFSIEIKQQSPSIIQPVLDQINAAHLHDRVVVGAFDDSVLAQVREADPTLLTTLGTTEGFQIYSLTPADEAGYVPPAPFFAAPLEYGPITLVQADIEKAHRLGLTLHVWTVNDPADMDTVIGWGADGIISDDPATLQTKLEAAGVAVE